MSAKRKTTLLSRGGLWGVQLRLVRLAELSFVTVLEKLHLDSLSIPPNAFQNESVALESVSKLKLGKPMTHLGY